MSLYQKLDRFPPVLVRLLAKNPDGSAMTDNQIATKTIHYLSIADVKRLSFLTSWDQVVISQMLGFCQACGVDFSNREQMRNANRYLKDPKFVHLKNSPEFPAFKLMLKTYLDSIRK